MNCQEVLTFRMRTAKLHVSGPLDADSDIEAPFCWLVLPFQATVASRRRAIGRIDEADHGAARGDDEGELRVNTHLQGDYEAVDQAIRHTTNLPNQNAEERS